MVAVGGFWFIPATKIAAFWAFLVGVCIIAAGLTFLETIANPYTTVLGDQRYGASAMDSAKVALELGARELIIVYAGALSDMHWHMPDAWFRTPGVHFMTLTRPVGYRVDAGGKVTGLNILRNPCGVSVGTPESGDILEADLVIEAMGLGVEASLAAALQGCPSSVDGLLRPPDPGLLACGLSGVFAGGGVINGGASVVQCVAEGMRAGREMDGFLLGGGQREDGRTT